MRSEIVHYNETEKRIKELEEEVELLRQELQSTKEKDEAGRKKGEEDLRIALEHLKFHVENSPFAVIEFNEKLQIIGWSPKAEAMFGWKADEIIGNELFIIPWVSAKDAERLSLLAADMISGKIKSSINVFRNYRKDGTLITCEWYNSVLTSSDGVLLSVHSLVQDVTEREDLKKKLTHSHTLMQYIIEHDRNAIAVLNRDLKYIYVSARFLSDYKLKETDIIGKNHYDLFPDLPLGWKDIHKRALAGEILSAEEDPYFREDGNIEWVRWECRPWYELDCSIGGIILYTEVITKQKESEIELIIAKERAEESEAYKTEVLKKLDEAQHMGKIGSWDWNIPSGKVWWSDELYNIFEVDPREYIPPVDANEKFIHPDDTEGYHQAVVNALKTGEILDYQLRIITSTGKSKYCRSAAKVYFDENNNAIRMSGTFTDITEQIIIQNELNAAKEKAEGSDRLKTAFLQNISHEVRTPLNSIVGFSELLSEPGQSQANIKAFSEIISASSDKLIGIITDVIEISQIQSNQVEVILTSFNVAAVVSSIVDDFRETARRKNIILSLKQNIPYDRSLILSDSSKLKKIFTHLIDNAIKFTPRGSVEVTCEIEGESFVFTISDTGIGMTDDEQITIFEPFSQLETRLSKNQGGNGLGLAIVKAYTRRLKGNLSLSSEKNKGTTISVSIPLNREVIKPDKEINEAAGTTTTPGFSKDAVNTILIAEDEYGNYRYLYELLLSSHTKILHASNGEEAIEACRNNEDIDMILMDIKMPVMDGDSAARAIKQFRPHIPIIAQTAYAIESEKINYLNTFDDLISKPINRKELREKMEKYMHVTI